MAPQYPVEVDVAFLADTGREFDVQATTSETDHAQSPWSTQRRRCGRQPVRREQKGLVGHALPAELRDPLWRSQIRQWTQQDVIDHVNDQLRQGLLELGLDIGPAGALVRQFSEAAEQWLFIGHPCEARIRCRQELHSAMGRELGQMLHKKQLERACQLLSKAWMLLQIWDGAAVKVQGAYRALQQEIRLCLAYSIVKESMRDSAVNLMLYISACSPQSPFFDELAARIESVAEDTADVVDTFKSYISSILGRMESSTVIH